MQLWGSSSRETIYAPLRCRILRVRWGLPERDRGEPTSSAPSRPISWPASSTATLSSPSSSASVLRRFRDAGLGGSSVSSDGDFRFRRERDPSIGSSSKMRVLNTEWESGLIPPRAAGKRSRAILGADDRRRDESIFGTLWKSASKPFATQSLHRQSVASKVLVSNCPMAWHCLDWGYATYLRRKLASQRLWHIVCELQVRSQPLDPEFI